MSDEPDQPELYSLKTEERSVVNLLIEAIRVILRRRDIEPFTIHMCGVALHALQRLPLVTKNVGFRVDLVHRHEDGSMESLGLRIDGDSIDFDSSGSIYTPGVGPDSYSNNLLSVGVGGREDNADFVEVEDWANWFRRSAAEREVEFEYFGDGEPDWNYATDPEQYWDQLDSDFA